MKAILSKRTVLFYTPLILFVTVIAMTSVANAELISAGGNVVQLTGGGYGPLPPAGASNGAPGSPGAAWVTDAPCGGTGDYFSCGDIPILVIDLGAEIIMDGIAFWNYGGNNNCATEFSLRFGTEADGSENIGASIGYNPVFTTDIPGSTEQQDFAFDTVIVARYVEVTLTDNMYGYQNGQAGGDRVGFAEIQFNVVLPDKAWDSQPSNGAKDLPQEVTLGWSTMVDPNSGLVDQTLIEHVLYMSDGSPTDANVIELDRIAANSPVAAQVQYGPLSLELGNTYYWRVDEITDANTIKGDLWVFHTAFPVPTIVTQPVGALLFEGESVTLSVEATNPYSQDTSGLTYQWYNADGPVGDGSMTYEIASLTTENEGDYYCVVTIVDPAINSISTSQTVALITKQLIGHWPFDGDLTNLIDDNAGTFTGQGDPGFVSGIIGDGQAIEFSEGGSPVTVPTDAHTNTAWTLSWWENSDAASGGGWETMIGCGADADGWGIFEFGRHNGSGYAFGILNNYQYADPDDTYPRDQWHFHVFTYDASTKTGAWYIDGVKLRGYNALNFTAFDVELSIGNVKGLSQPFMGLIDDLKLYNYAVDPFVLADEYTAVTGETVCVEYPDTDVTGPDGVPDCKVDLNDLAEIISQWLTHGYYPARP